MDAHRATEFRKFLDEIEAAVPDDLEVHLVMDNYATLSTGKWEVPGAYSKNGDNCQMQLRRRVRTH